MIQKIISIITGSIFVAIGINYFLIPNHLLDGGIIGLGLISKYALGLKPGLTIIVLSLPLYLIAWFRYRTYFYNGLHGLLVSSFFIDYFHPLSQLHTAPILISSLFGGLMIGTGIGIMMLTKTSTGGTDLLALMLAKLTSLNVGIFILLMDSFVILFGWIVIQKATITYSAILVLMVGLTTYVITSCFTLEEESS
ncbi:YitT family protein [Lentibacillus sp. Marseille-P4043]|uniref:YitT family protein n=1 Tax=Lentibacillus sp. Marseille-P4043 TaxID=2040293 RepID=UPI000D0ACF6A|nr:YitT family protein [Lentibacillus sp. Marseille-P4043]